ncbi:hypothetical protein BofuT4_uP017940.1 [Botrytis cinerea T4]|uniref:Uncharacterized protein n=1 Tax=Botryotinia fuckeliana (strain T4) TaxID=999810 RepID=G2YIF1_BOTF4|nr:hypothetical protein BofuT4_uP017940.1 [Botrytis cinerea T4]
MPIPNFHGAKELMMGEFVIRNTQRKSWGWRYLGIQPERGRGGSSSDHLGQ